MSPAVRCAGANEEQTQQPRMKSVHPAHRVGFITRLIRRTNARRRSALPTLIGQRVRRSTHVFAARDFDAREILIVVQCGVQAERIAEPILGEQTCVDALLWKKKCVERRHSGRYESGSIKISDTCGECRDEHAAEQVRDADIASIALIEACPSSC